MADYDDSELVLVGGVLVAGVLWGASLLGAKGGGSRPRPQQRKRQRQFQPTATYWQLIGVAPNAEDIDTLGRVIRSESGRQDLATQAAVAWVARNKAARRGMRLTDYLCRPCGKQGEKMANGRSRTFSTRQTSTAKTRQLAAAVLAVAQAKDPTGGATSMFEPGLQDRLYASGRYKRNAAMIRERWRNKYKLTRYGTVGKWELWGHPKT